MSGFSRTRVKFCLNSSSVVTRCTAAHIAFSCGFARHVFLVLMLALLSGIANTSIGNGGGSFDIRWFV